MNKFLQRAFEIASQVDPHSVTPNPRVGCVIVRNGAIVEEGVHEKFGGGHAEVNAIENLQKSPLSKGDLGGFLSDCQVYVTLEPCDCFSGKKTGACVDLLIKYKPKKVVIGSLDPTFGGRSVNKMEKAGILIEMPTANSQKLQADLNPFFDHYQKNKKPGITLKIGQSLDGKITGGNPYITNQSSLKKVHQMRAAYSVILTTTETVLEDDPRLDTRFDMGTNADIIILGKREIPETAKIWQIENRNIHQFATLDEFLESEIYTQIDSIMTESGAEMNTLLVDRGMVDQIDFFVAPQIIGNTEKQNFEKEINLEDFQLRVSESREGDLWLQYIKNTTKTPSV